MPTYCVKVSRGSAEDTRSVPTKAPLTRRKFSSPTLSTLHPGLASKQLIILATPLQEVPILLVEAASTRRSVGRNSTSYLIHTAPTPASPFQSGGPTFALRCRSCSHPRTGKVVLLQGLSGGQIKQCSSMCSRLREY
ncbi:hypothetical protein HO173_005880 [Letharia columbiana]|uniref:Uncharacterized protein n=1 Tax=Letharia columbiana TaxID=112416 RepID=A0A8H6FWY2_9LECA|nr:uncharacterized protein HO173_005880 [Letharia columbiana]KAF6236249.1 hypothetical protein HO173_005880 [Letharia columbiana]